MIADIMFPLIFLPGHLQQVGDAGSVSFSHDSICRVKISQALWLHRLWFTLCFHWIFFQDIYSKLVMLALALCAFHTTVSCENRTEAEVLWLALIAQTLIHIIYVFKNFLPGHLQQVGDAGFVCFSHDSVVGKSHFDRRFDCFDSLATNCFAVFPGQLTHTHTHLLYFLTCHELWVVGPKQDASNMSNHKCFKLWTKGFPQNQNQTQWFGHHWTIKMMFKHHQTFEHHQNHSGLQKHQHHDVVYHDKSSWCSIYATSQANQKVQSKWDLSISQVDQRSSEYQLVNSVIERDLNLLNTYM